jgi:hypothetical protein
VPERKSALDDEIRDMIKGQTALWSMNGELKDGKTISLQDIRAVDAFVTHVADEWASLGLSRKFVRERLVCCLKSRADPTEAMLGRVLPRKKMLKSGEWRYYDFKVTLGGLKRVTVDLTEDANAEDDESAVTDDAAGTEDVEVPEVVVKKEVVEEEPFNCGELLLGNAVAFGAPEQPEMGARNAYVGYGTVRAGFAFIFYFPLLLHVYCM